MFFIAFEIEQAVMSLSSVTFFLTLTCARLYRHLVSAGCDGAASPVCRC